MPRIDLHSACAAFCLGFILTGLVLFSADGTARANDAGAASTREQKRTARPNRIQAHKPTQPDTASEKLDPLPERFLAFDVSRPFGSHRTAFKAEVWDRFCKEALRGGRRMVVVQARGSKTVSPYADLLLQGARREGIRTAAYLFLTFYHDEPSGDQQVLEALNAMGSEAKYLDFLVVDVESGAAGGMTPAERVNRIGQAVDEVTKARLHPVIYAKNTGGRQGEWTDLTGNSDDFSYLPLWVPRYDCLASIESDATSGEWLPFGGWSARHGKQFADDRLTAAPSGLPADESIFSRAVLNGPTEARAYSVTPMLEVVAGRATLEKGTGAIVQPVKLVNKSNSPIRGPLSLVLEGLAGKISLANLHGRSIEAGKPYIQIASKTMPPGASLRTELRFSASPGDIVGQPRYQLEVRAGSGKV